MAHSYSKCTIFARCKIEQTPCLINKGQALAVSVSILQQYVSDIIGILESNYSLTAFHSNLYDLANYLTKLGAHMCFCKPRREGLIKEATISNIVLVRNKQKLKILIIYNFFSCKLMTRKLCTVIALGNI